MQKGFDLYLKYESRFEEVNPYLKGYFLRKIALKALKIANRNADDDFRKHTLRRFIPMENNPFRLKTLWDRVHTKSLSPFFRYSHSFQVKNPENMKEATTDIYSGFFLIFLNSNKRIGKDTKLRKKDADLFSTICNVSKS